MTATRDEARPSQPAATRNPSRWLDTTGNFLLRLLPIAAAFAAYALAGQARSPSPASQRLVDLGPLQNLVQLAIGLITGIAVYVIISELTLHRLPRRLRSEVEVLDSELKLLRELTTELKAVVLEQFQALATLSEMEVSYGDVDALERARRLHASASKSVEAMWTLVPYDDALKDYFSETLAEKIYTCRLVATQTVSRSDLLDHIERSWDYLAAGTYEIYVVSECHYEALVVNHDNAGLFFYSNRGYGSCFLSSKRPDFVQVVQGLHEGLKRADRRVPIDPGTPKDLERLGSWLANYYPV